MSDHGHEQDWARQRVFDAVAELQSAYANAVSGVQEAVWDYSCAVEAYEGWNTEPVDYTIGVWLPPGLSHEYLDEGSIRLIGKHRTAWKTLRMLAPRVAEAQLAVRTAFRDLCAVQRDASVPEVEQAVSERSAKVEAAQEAALVALRRWMGLPEEG